MRSLSLVVRHTRGLFDIPIYTVPLGRLTTLRYIRTVIQNVNAVPSHGFHAMIGNLLLSPFIAGTF